MGFGFRPYVFLFELVRSREVKDDNTDRRVINRFRLMF